MAALISWLDASPEEQRRVREIVRLFSQRETQDEMGGRRIVVALSDALFPGTSVLHSRARYLIFIPWFLQRAARSKHPMRRFEGLERNMIRAFRENEDVDDPDRVVGLIGREAGPTVKQLPSTAYWTALQEWGILEWRGTVDATLERTRRLSSWRAGDDLDEAAHRDLRVWHHGVGELPPGFPDDDLCGGFRLSHGEASWLRERWLDTASGSMLAHLASSGAAVEASYAWDEPGCRSASEENVALLDQAQRFALAIHGPQLLYALMLAERYQDRGFDRVDVNLESYRSAITEWAEDVQDASHLFDGWNVQAFWDDLRVHGATIDPLSTAFFTVWLETVRSGTVDIADDAALRLEVANREARTKPGSGRLQNDSLLASWVGGSSGRTTFRWPQVRSLVNDVAAGLGGADAVA